MTWVKPGVAAGFRRQQRACTSEIRRIARRTRGRPCPTPGYRWRVRTCVGTDRRELSEIGKEGRQGAIHALRGFVLNPMTNVLETDLFDDVGLGFAKSRQSRCSRMEHLG